MIRLPRLAAALATAASLAGGPALGEPRSLSDVVYDYAVTNYCGLTSHQVEQGFRREMARLVARDRLDEEAARRARIKGWLAADLEWGNRGLGGFRGWCATEGLAAVEHFRTIDGGAATP